MPLKQAKAISNRHSQREEKKNGRNQQPAQLKFGQNPKCHAHIINENRPNYYFFPFALRFSTFYPLHYAFHFPSPPSTSLHSTSLYLSPHLTPIPVNSFRNGSTLALGVRLKFECFLND